MIDDFAEDDYNEEEEDEEEEESLSESVETTTTRFGRFMSPLAFSKFSETLGKHLIFRAPDFFGVSVLRWLQMIDLHITVDVMPYDAFFYVLGKSFFFQFFFQQKL